MQTGNDQNMEGYFSLGKDVNKAKDKDSLGGKEGIVSALVPELDLDAKDEDIIARTTEWTQNWTDYLAGDLSKMRADNKKYWLGKHHSHQAQQSEKRPMVDNVIFEANENFLAECTQQDPDPVVTSDNTPEGNKLADHVQKMLIDWADTCHLKLKIRSAGRDWMINLLGAIKMTWNQVSNNIDIERINPNLLILEPDACINEGAEYTGHYLGQNRKERASWLVERFPDKAEWIKGQVDGKMGTKLGFTEWWTADSELFYTCKTEVLGKSKNPHWNYNTTKESNDDFGAPITVDVTGKNHFKIPPIPFSFISVYTLGEHPHDETSLITQALSLQDIVNKRLKQMDKNADNANSGLIVAGGAFTREEASLAAAALRSGGVVVAPGDDVNKAAKRDQPTPLPDFVITNYTDTRNEIRNIFGVQGLSTSGIANEKTKAGKQYIQSRDAQRMGPVTEYLEQCADRIYNLAIQFMMVYYTEEHMATIVGKQKALETITLKSEDFDRRLSATVKPGSMIPEDPISRRDQAIELWGADALDPVSLFEAMDDPDPVGKAKQLILWKTDPATYLAQFSQPAGAPAPAPAQPPLNSNPNGTQTPNAALAGG